MPENLGLAMAATFSATPASVGPGKSSSVTTADSLETPGDPSPPSGASLGFPDGPPGSPFS